MLIQAGCTKLLNRVYRRRSIRFRRLVRLLLIIICLGSVCSYAQERVVVYAGLKPTAQSFVLGQPITVDLEISGIQPFSIDLGPNRNGNLRFIVKDPTGREREARLALPDFTGGGSINVSPDSIYVQRINLTSLLSSQTVGKYTISVFLDKESNQGIALSLGPPIDLAISTADSNRLKEVSEEISQNIEKASSASERLELTSELVSIHDPVVVSSIRSLLRRGFGIDSDLVGSLALIRNQDAVDALAYAMGSPDDVVATQARSALLNISSQATNEAVRTRANKALQQ